MLLYIYIYVLNIPNTINKKQTITIKNNKKKKVVTIFIVLIYNWSQAIRRTRIEEKD
jgi:hypothetical protein